MDRVRFNILNPPNPSSSQDMGFGGSGYGPLGSKPSDLSEQNLAGFTIPQQPLPLRGRPQLGPSSTTSDASMDLISDTPQEPEARRVVIPLMAP